METIGSLIDKLVTVDMKMFYNQEFIYEIRKMSQEEFMNKYYGKEQNLLDLYESLQKACDLNVQRNDLIYEIDKHFNELKENYAKNPHKTY